MTQGTVSDSPAPKAPAPPRRSLFLAVAAAVVVAAGIAFDTTVVQIGSDADARQQAFSADAYGEEEFPRIQEFVTGRAVDAAVLAEAVQTDKEAAVEEYGTAASTGAIMPVTLSGVVGEGKSGVYTLTVDDMPGDITIRVQTGPAINGTDLRDAPGDIEFGQFKNQIQYQDAGAAINRAMKAAVLDSIDNTALGGKTVQVTGVFRLINAKNWMITPVSLEMQ